MPLGGSLKVKTAYLGRTCESVALESACSRMDVERPVSGRLQYALSLDRVQGGVAVVPQLFCQPPGPARIPPHRI